MIFVVLMLLVLIYFVMTFNSLIVVTNNVEKAWANIDVLLKQRHDEIPKLIEICKAYMQHEQVTFEKLITARAGVNLAREAHDVIALGNGETSLHSHLGHLFAIAERYPDLKSNQNFLQLQKRITDLENAIADRREFYNESVNVNNIRVQQFPDLLVAFLFDFRPQEMLQFSHLASVNVDADKPESSTISL